LDKKTKHKDEFLQQCLEKLATCLQAGTPVRHGVWTSREEDVIILHRLTTCKPIVYLINLTEADFARQKNKWLAKTYRWIKEHDPGAPIVPYCATFEERLQSLEGDEDRLECMKEVGVTKSMRDRMVDAGYEATGTIRFYTKLNGVAMVWSVPMGVKAPQAAGTVHTDLEAPFAGVEVTSFGEYTSEENEAALKQAGKIHQKGKDYVISDGDVIHFKSTGSPKSKPNSNPSTPVHKSAHGSPTNRPTPPKFCLDG